jgi:hypothetical protein
MTTITDVGRKTLIANLFTLRLNTTLNPVTDLWSAIHQFLRMIPNLRILVLPPVSTLRYVVKVNNYF